MLGTSHLGSLEEAWKQTLNKISKVVGLQIFEAYFATLALNESQSSSSQIILETNSHFVARKIESEFAHLIASAWCELFGFPINIKIQVCHNTARSTFSKPTVVVKQQLATVASRASNKVNGAVQEKSFNEGLISPHYNFANFVVGNSNQFCHAAARQVAENPGKTYNPLFIYGGVGLGKTHLLNAIANDVKARHPERTVLYLSSENFTNTLINSLRTGKMNIFKEQLRNVDLLLLDDIQFISGKERTQEELFHTFNALYSSGAQIILTSDKMPQELNGIEDRLRTRFSWGLTADLQPPDFETRLAILRKKASAEQINISDKVLSMVAEKIFHNVRELEGALTRIHALSSLQHQPINMVMAEAVIAKLVKPKIIQITVEQIKTTVARKFKIKVVDLISKRRTRNICYPRQIAMFLCRRHTTASYPEIGAAFGGRDHSSVIHAANVVSEQIRKDYETQLLIKDIEADLFQ